MKQLAESEKYVILYEYEKAYLRIKNSNKLILIGEFYGDPYTAIISKNEDFCVVCGEGIIIYFLTEPYYEFNSNNKHSKQWKEWGRDNENDTVWIDTVEQIEDKTIRLITENNEQIIINI